MCYTVHVTKNVFISLSILYVAENEMSAVDVLFFVLQSHS